MKKFIPLTVVLLVSACASTGVVPLGQDTYFIGKKDGSTGLGVSYKVKAEVYKEANDFCGQKGLDVQTIEVSTIPAKLAQLGSTELKFKCISAQ